MGGQIFPGATEETVVKRMHKLLIVTDVMVRKIRPDHSPRVVKLYEGDTIHGRLYPKQTEYGVEVVTIKMPGTGASLCDVPFECCRFVESGEISSVG